MASEKKTDKFSSFSYIATNPTSGVVRGELRASGQDSALIQLERMGLKPISVSKKSTSILDTQISFLEKVPPEDIYNFTRQLSVMLKGPANAKPKKKIYKFVYHDSDVDLEKGADTPIKCKKKTK